MKPVKNTQQIQWAIAENDGTDYDPFSPTQHPSSFGLIYDYKKGDKGMILSEDDLHFHFEIRTSEGKYYYKALQEKWRRI